MNLDTVDFNGVSYYYHGLLNFQKSYRADEFQILGFYLLRFHLHGLFILHSLPLEHHS